MGQYHKVVNLDKKEVLNAHRFGCGIKLLEFSESRVSTALCVLLAVSNGRGGGDLNSENSLIGSWGGDRIAIVGDYWEDEEAKETGIPTWGMMKEEPEDGGDEYQDISLKVLQAMCEDKWIRDELLVDVARYDWGNDWSSIFSAEEITNAREQREKEGEQ